MIAMRFAHKCVGDVAPVAEGNPRHWYGGDALQEHAAEQLAITRCDRGKPGPRGKSLSKPRREPGREHSKCLCFLLLRRARKPTKRCKFLGISRQRKANHRGVW